MDREDDEEDGRKRRRLDGADGQDRTLPLLSGALLERDVGITEYRSPLQNSIQGIIKQRYSDFIVNEVALDGTIERLTQTTLAPELGGPSEVDQKEAGTATVTSAAAGPAPKRLDLNEEARALLSAQASPKVLAELEDLIAGPLGNKAREVITTEPMTDKAQRTRFHEMIRTISRGVLQTSVTPLGEIQISLVNKHNPAHRRSNGTRTPQPPQGKRFVHFLLFKKNRDTTDALGFLARTFRPIGRAPLRVSDFHIRGTKDKRAVSTQRISLALKDLGRGGVPSLWKMMGEGRGRSGIRLGNWEWAEKDIRLGELLGNRFSIVLRNVQLANGERGDLLERQVKDLVQSLETNGFINYFGMQRFGTSSIGTHRVGAALLNSNWSRAISLIMQPRDYDADDIDQARRAYCDGLDLESLSDDDFRARAAKGFKAFPAYCTAERALLAFWMNGGSRNPFASLAVIPRGLRTMYTHAYQSYVWNKITSERIKLSTGLCQGDLVIVQDAELQTDEEADETMGASRGRSSASKIHVVTAADVESKQYTILDVVLPLPGDKVTYPQGRIGELYIAVMEEDGLCPDRMAEIHHDYQLTGFYRNIVEKPSDLSWRLIDYDDPHTPLIVSDEDRLQAPEIQDPADSSRGNLTALRLEFSLRSSTYATMALREVLHHDTSSAQQTLLTERAAMPPATANGKMGWSIQWEKESAAMYALLEQRKANGLAEQNGDTSLANVTNSVPSKVDHIDLHLLGSKIHEALVTIEEALARFGPEAIALAVNGGKESGVVLHLYSLAYHRYCQANKLSFEKIKSIYVCSPDPFPQVETFVEESRMAYHLDLVRIDGGMRDALTEYKKMDPGVQCVLVGTRRHDPHGGDLTPFKQTDVGKGWPDYVRCHPIIDWSYRDVWDFIRRLEVKHCVLYDLGYSSLGSVKDTLPNPILRNEAISTGWNPAWMLSDESLERAGRK